MANEKENSRGMNTPRKVAEKATERQKQPEVSADLDPGAGTDLTQAGEKLHHAIEQGKIDPNQTTPIPNPDRVGEPVTHKKRAA